MSDWVIQKFSRSHDRSQFDCGYKMLDEWLRKQAGQFEKKGLARTYVAVRAGESFVAGYYAISNHRLSYEALSADQAKGLPRLDVPVILLGRLAVDKSEQGHGLGELLLIDALRRASHISQQIGVRAVEVDAIDDSARRFYLKYGFSALEDDRRHMFLPISVIRQLKLPPL